MTDYEKDLAATYEELGRLVRKKTKIEAELSRVINKIERLERDHTNSTRSEK